MGYLKKLTCNESVTKMMMFLKVQIDHKQNLFSVPHTFSKKNLFSSVWETEAMLWGDYFVRWFKLTKYLVRLPTRDFVSHVNTGCYWHFRGSSLDSPLTHLPPPSLLLLFPIVLLICSKSQPSPLLHSCPLKPLTVNSVQCSSVWKQIF